MVMRHRVAIKLLPTQLASQTSYLERFHQEARASARLNHPNMVRASDVDHEENIHYLVMEYVEGTDLQAIVSRSGPLPYRMAADYTRQAAEGLAYAHRAGLIHRDIKPANLLVDKTGTVKILDMGLARFSDETQASLTHGLRSEDDRHGRLSGAEQALDSHKVDARADIYSLGCTLYFMLTGDAPFPQGTIPQRLMQHQSAEPTDIRKTRPDAPEELLAICRKMMAKSRRRPLSDRPTTWPWRWPNGSRRSRRSPWPSAIRLPADLRRTTIWDLRRSTTSRAAEDPSRAIRRPAALVRSADQRHRVVRHQARVITLAQQGRAVGSEDHIEIRCQAWR